MPTHSISERRCLASSGSSIGWVHDQAVENYATVAASLEGIIARSLAAQSGASVQLENRAGGGLEAKIVVRTAVRPIRQALSGPTPADLTQPGHAG